MSANQAVNGLAPGASTSVTFNITGLWADCAERDCQFTATVDPADASGECDGTNNQRAETYTSTLPDLVVTDIDFSNVTYTSDNVSGSVAVSALARRAAM